VQEKPRNALSEPSVDFDRDQSSARRAMGQIRCVRLMCFRTTVGEVCRKMGIAQATFYRRKQPYGGLMWSEVKKLRGLEEKDSRLRKVVPDLTLDRCCRR
jgi:hypothetical protein